MTDYSKENTVNLNYKYVFLFLFLSSLASFYFHLSHYNHRKHSLKKIKIISTVDSIATIKLSVVGDLMCHAPQYNSANIDSGDAFDFKDVFSQIDPLLRNADFTLGNLETVISENNSKLSGYPNFNSPVEFVTSLKSVGFDILFTANNHSFDKGRKGLLSTISNIKKSGIHYVGTYNSNADKDSIRIFKRNGISFALLAYTYGSNEFPPEKNSKYGIKIIDKNRIKNDLTNAAELSPDLVIVYFHFGKEYQRKPSKYQRNIVSFAIKNGADIILGSHPHVIQPIEKFKSNSGRIDSGFVAYSLGNFISNQRWRYSDGGGILNISINKNINTGFVFINKINFLPTWVFKGEIDNKVQYRILSKKTSTDTLGYLTSEDKLNMNRFYDDVKSIWD